MYGKGPYVREGGKVHVRDDGGGICTGGRKRFLPHRMEYVPPEPDASQLLNALAMH